MDEQFPDTAFMEAPATGAAFPAKLRADTLLHSVGELMVATAPLLDALDADPDTTSAQQAAVLMAQLLRSALPAPAADVAPVDNSTATALSPALDFAARWTDDAQACALNAAQALHTLHGISRLAGCLMADVQRIIARCSAASTSEVLQQFDSVSVADDSVAGVPAVDSPPAATTDMTAAVSVTAAFAMAENSDYTAGVRWAQRWQRPAMPAETLFDAGAQSAVEDTGLAA